MNHDVYRLQEVAPFVMATFALLGLACPAIVFSLTRRWARESPEMGGVLAGGAIAVSMLSLLIAGTVALVLLGWLPPLDSLLDRGATSFSP